MRNTVMCLLAVVACIAACGGTTSERQGLEDAPASATAGGGRAPLSSFVPPTPAGCAGAQAYDVCLALDAATPVAVRVIRPSIERADAVAIVHFRRVEGARDRFDFEHVKFRAHGAGDLRLYFQLPPGVYRIAVGIDADGDDDPNGPADDLGWSAVSPDVAVVDEASAALVDVGTTPIETTFMMATRR